MRYGGSAGSGDVVDGKRTTPLGIVNYAGTQQITGVGTLTLDHFLDAMGLLLAANVDPTRCRIFMRSETFIGARKIKESGTSAKYLLTPDPTADGLFRIFGMPLVVTNRLPKTTGATPTTSIVVADMSQIAVARDMSPSVKLLDQLYADFDQQAIRVVSRWDAAPLNPDAVVVLRGVSV